MKIVSDFHDYYDTGMGLGGYDDKTLFVRERTEFDMQKNKNIPSVIKELYTKSGSIPSHSYMSDLNFFKIIFCGKVYPAVMSNNVVGYDIQTAEKFEREDVDTNSHHKFFVYPRKNRVKDFFLGNRDISPFLIENKITIAAVDNDTIVINPSLKKLQFFRVFDSFTAYQELEMYVGGVLAYPQNITFDIPDQFKIQQYGFDTKYGFRHRPNKELKC